MVYISNIPLSLRDTLQFNPLWSIVFDNSNR